MVAQIVGSPRRCLPVTEALVTLEPLDEEWLLDNSVAIGPGVMLPERFAVRAEFEGMTAEVEVVVDIRGPRAHRVTVVEAGDGGVNSEALRKAPVASVVKYAAHQAVWMRHEALSNQPGIIRGHVLARVPDLVRGQWPNGHMTFFLRWVAGVYLVADALGDGPTAAVAKAFEVSRATAGRYVDAARKPRLIPPVGKGYSRPATDEEKTELRQNLGLPDDVDMSDHFVVGIENSDEMIDWFREPFEGWRRQRSDERG